MVGFFRCITSRAQKPRGFCGWKFLEPCEGLRQAHPPESIAVASFCGTARVRNRALVPGRARAGGGAGAAGAGRARAEAAAAVARLDCCGAAGPVSEAAPRREGGGLERAASEPAGGLGRLRGGVRDPVAPAARPGRPFLRAPIRAQIRPRARGLSTPGWRTPLARPPPPGRSPFPARRRRPRPTSRSRHCFPGVDLLGPRLSRGAGQRRSPSPVVPLGGQPRLRSRRGAGAGLLPGD